MNNCNIALEHQCLAKHSVRRAALKKKEGFSHKSGIFSYFEGHWKEMYLTSQTCKITAFIESGWQFPLRNAVTHFYPPSH